MSTLSKPLLTEEQYLELERKAEYKSEYYQGEMYPMAGPRTESIAGARRNHNRVATNTAGQLYLQLRGRDCEVFSAGMRVRVGTARFYSYPDIVVACQPEFHDQEGDTLLNPVIVIEVLSPATEAYDRGKKFALYEMLASLQEYVLISSDRMQVELFRRQSSGQWLLTRVSRPEDSITLESAGCTLKVSDLYERVELPAIRPGAETS